MATTEKGRAAGPFLENAWYMAAWSDELGDGLLSRRLLGRRIVLYRLENGSVAALTDRCPHRFFPLSESTRKGDAIQCGYHGLVFDAAGACIHNPFSEKLPIGVSIQTWPVAERDGIVWLWPGDPRKCDPTLIPDFSAIRCPTGKPPVKGYTHSTAQYEYLTDNLMDLSHVEFVHRGTFGIDDLLFSGQHNLHREGNVVVTDWFIAGQAAPPWFWWRFGPDAKVDQWMNMRWEAPAVMQLQIGVTAQSQPREQGSVVRQAHIITPETAGSSHYFWSTTRFDPDASDEADAVLRERQIQAFEREDKPVIEAAYANLEGGDFWEQKPVFLGFDTGPAMVRRILQKMIADEARQATSAQCKEMEQLADGR